MIGWPFLHGSIQKKFKGSQIQSEVQVTKVVIVPASLSPTAHSLRGPQIRAHLGYIWTDALGAHVDQISSLLRVLRVLETVGSGYGCLSSCCVARTTHSDANVFTVVSSLVFKNHSGSKKFLVKISSPQNTSWNPHTLNWCFTDSLCLIFRDEKAPSRTGFTGLLGISQKHSLCTTLKFWKGTQRNHCAF